MEKNLTIIWCAPHMRGAVKSVHGTLIQVTPGDLTNGERAAFQTDNGRLRLTVRYPSQQSRAYVQVHVTPHPFTFFIDDVTADYPVYVAGYEVVVTEGDDPRSYEQIVDVIRRQGRLTALQQSASAPDESYASAVASTHALPGPTWLGLGRDVRAFTFNFRGHDVDRMSDREWDWVQPRRHANELVLPESLDGPVRYLFFLGRGVGPTQTVHRCLEQGTLPIVHGQLIDDEITYDTRCFVAWEGTNLASDTVGGTHFLVADGYGHGHMLTDAQQRQRSALLALDSADSQVPVFYFRAVATNHGTVPRYAWFKTALPAGIPYHFDEARGWSMFSTDRVFAVSSLNGEPLRMEESAILLAPGKSAVFQFYLPHQPISSQRARRLAAQDFDSRWTECRHYWSHKLDGAAHVQLPEAEVQERLYAGLLHLDLVSYGEEPNGPLAPMVGGHYTAIGSESAPMIQFMDSMGWDRSAERSLQYFLEKQHPDGFMQNFGGYMLETGAVLWSLGEHYRYTRNEDWVARIASHVILACDYLVDWRQRNLTDPTNPGNGLLDGKCADPEDPYHAFMLNGYAYLGLSRASEMLHDQDPERSVFYQREADALKASIWNAIRSSLAAGPVVPIGDGSWCPTLSPWPGHPGPVALYAEGGRWFSHGTIATRDSLLGPLWLVFQEVVDPTDPLTDDLLNYHAELFCSRNVAFSQPYYSIHPWVHLNRGEVASFLKAFYTMMASLSDRETYSFWEHYFHASPHKTHEEAWFLMQVRWMLYLESHDGLRILPGIPRKWLADGSRIRAQNVKSYFGSLSIAVDSHVDQGRITVEVSCPSNRCPSRLTVRLPHPEGRRVAHVDIGVPYDVETESVQVDNFTGQIRLTVQFER